MAMTNESGVVSIACTKGLFIVRSDKNESLSTLFARLKGQLFHAISYVDESTVIL